MPPVENLFFAVLPDAETAAGIARLTDRLRRVHGLSGRPTPARRLHVSLYGLGAFSALAKADADAAGGFAAAVRAQSFDVAFDRVMSFSHPADKPLILAGGEGVAGLVALRAQLARSVAEKTLGRTRSQAFVPHITLLRDRNHVDEHPVEPVSWAVREFVLVRSLVGKSVYEILSRWPLRD